MKEGKLPTLVQIKKLMVKIASENGIKKQVNNTRRHSVVVWHLADKIACLASKNGYKVDRKFLKVGCYIHDIGRMVTGSKGSKELQPDIFHFYEGYYIMIAHNYPELARICVCHACGAGLDKKINKRYNFIARNFFPRTIEEKIIAYADARTDYKKGKGSYIWPFTKAYNRFKKYSGVGKRLKQNHQFIKRITKGKII